LEAKIVAVLLVLSIYSKKQEAQLMEEGAKGGQLQK
jgi:hypothetical protein